MKYIKLADMALYLDRKGFYKKADLITRKLIKVSQEQEQAEEFEKDPPFELREGETSNDPKTVMKYFIGFAFDMFTRNSNISKPRMKMELEKKIAEKIESMSPENQEKFSNLKIDVLADLEKQAWYKDLPETQEQDFGPDEHYEGRNTEDFIKSFSGPAKEASASSGNLIPPSVILAMAAWESGWGKSDLAAEYGNFFGIKHSPTSGSKSGVSMETKEYNGGEHKEIATFAQFSGSLASKLSALPNFLKNNRRYSKVLKAGKNYNNTKSMSDLHALIDAIFDAGYSSDLKQPGNIKKLIDQHGLTQFD
jgi:flagellum-specific peptidoglycan hydrolase FlgJ